MQPHDTAPDECAAIAASGDVLGLFAAALTSAGLVGEDRLAKLLYLALTSRVTDEPVSVAVKGPSSGGKSYAVKKVLEFFPDSAYHALSAMSEKAIVYSKEPLQHRFLVIYEAAGIQGVFAEFLIRTLLSEGRLRYETVDKAADGSLTPRFIEREGPTGLIVTTTLASMHPENETRYLSVTVVDTPEQTRHVMRMLARDVPVRAVDLEPWRLFQQWLEDGPREVVIPFADALVDLIPPVAVRLRRDFGKVLTLIRAHALLHRASRDRDGHGRIVAAIDDYRRIYDLVGDLIAAGVGATVPASVRETVEAVAALTRAVGVDTPRTATHIQVAGALGLDKSAAWRRVTVAIQMGYVENLEPRKGQRAQLVLGDPLPDDRTVLPHPGQIAEQWSGCTVARPTGGSNSDGREDIAQAA